MSMRFMSVKTTAVEHIKKHKEGYICLGIGVLIGVALMPRVVQVIYKSPGAVQTVALARRMHPGFRIVCEESGVEVASVNQMAKLMDLNPIKILQQARGLIENVDGFHFRILGEM